MEKVLEFLSANKVMYFATEEGNKPKVRPFGFFMEFEGKLYFGIGKHKQAYKQILANENVEVCTSSPQGQWIRISGKVKTDDRDEALKKAFETMPPLKDLYNEQTGAKLGLVYLDGGIAEIADMQGGFEQIVL